MGYTPLPEHVFHESHVKKIVATVLISIFLGIGVTYAMNRTASRQHPPVVITTISPSKIPTALPTQADTSLSCTSDAVCLQCPPGTEKDYPIYNNCAQGTCVNGSCRYTSPIASPTQRTAIKCATSNDCPAGAPCQNGLCIGLDYDMEKTTTPTCPPGKSTCPGDDHVVQQNSSSCPSGTVKVCQAGECECLPQ